MTSSPEEDLAFIRTMIERGREQFRHEGFYYVLYGGMAILGIGAMYAFPDLGGMALGLMWACLYAVAAVITIVKARMGRSPGRAAGPSIPARAALWCTAGGIVLMVLATVGLLEWNAAFAAFSVVMAVLYGVLAAALRSKALVALGASWFGVAVACLVVEPGMTFAAFGIGLAALEVVPGIVMLVRDGTGHAGT